MSSFDVPTLMQALRHHPVPLAHLIQLRDIVTEQSGQENFLFAACRDPEADGSTLADPELAGALTGVKLGQWPMGVAAIDLWAERVLERQPESILEFGSGVSTVVSALLMRRIHGDASQARVFSIEQGEEAGTETRQRLERLGLSDLVRMHIAPVQSICTDVFQSTGYGVSVEEMGRFLDGSRPEMVIIDGPLGGYGARFSTLPVSHPWLAEDAEIWMDDALRDSELAIAYWWAELGYMENPSLQFTAKGVVRGGRGSMPRHYREASDALRHGQVSGPSAEYVLFKMRLQSAADRAGGLKVPFQAL